MSRKTHRKIVIRIILSVIFVCVALRFTSYMVKFGNESLQMDFSASYTAAEAMNSGLSPYKNHIRRDPPIWDGVAIYKHSRFTYTPLVAFLTRPLALLPYKVAKWVWIYMLIISVAISLIIACKIIKLEMSAEVILGCGIFTCLFFPFLAEIERGQIDAINLLLIVLAILFMLKQDRGEYLSGGLISLATFFKPYCLFLVPFLLLRRKWRVLSGYAIGIVMLVIISFFSCRTLNIDYISKHLPRISQFQEEGTIDMMLPVMIVPLYLKYTNTPAGKTIKDGVYYYPSTLKFTHNATLVKAIKGTTLGKRLYILFNRTKFANHKDTFLSFLVLSVFALLIFLNLFKSFESRFEWSDVQEFLFWQIVLITIVLSGVRTWAMNTIWFMPGFVYALKEILQRDREKGVLRVLICLFGFAIAAVSDNIFVKIMPAGKNLLVYKYIISGIILFIGFLLMLRNNLQDSIRMKQSLKLPT